MSRYLSRPLKLSWDGNSLAEVLLDLVVVVLFALALFWSPGCKILGGTFLVELDYKNLEIVANFNWIANVCSRYCFNFGCINCCGCLQSTDQQFMWNIDEYDLFGKRSEGLQPNPMILPHSLSDVPDGLEAGECYH